MVQSDNSLIRHKLTGEKVKFISYNLFTVNEIFVEYNCGKIDGAWIKDFEISVDGQWKPLAEYLKGIHE